MKNAEDKTVVICDMFDDEIIKKQNTIQYWNF